MLIVVHIVISLNLKFIIILNCRLKFYGHLSLASM